jgi:hypothetical protein
MSDSILKGMKAFGLTPWQLVIGIALAWGWVTTLMPMPTEMAKLNETVSKLGTKVEIHAVLFGQLNELNSEVKGMRRELSTIEGRLSSNSQYKAKPGGGPAADP